MHTECLVNASKCFQNTTELEDEAEILVSLVVPFFFGLIGLAGLIGNALVLLVVASNPQMRSTTNLLIINLAIADLLFVFFCVPFTAIDYVLRNWPFGDYWCKIVQYMIVVTCHASVYTLVLMSLDRFLAVVHPIRSMSLRTERNAILGISFTWIIVTTTAVPVLLSHGEHPFAYKGLNYTACVFLTDLGYNLEWFQVSFLLSSYVLPLTLISLLYIGMLARLWKGPASGCGLSAESRRGKKKVTRMVVIVVLAFAVCWLPIQVILVLKALKYYEITHFTIALQIFGHVLAYSNSCVNPVLYAFLSENFRKAFRKVVWCGRPPPLGTRAGHTKTTRTGNGNSNADVL